MSNIDPSKNFVYNLKDIDWEERISLQEEYDIIQEGIDKLELKQREIRSRVDYKYTMWFDNGRDCEEDTSREYCSGCENYNFFPELSYIVEEAKSYSSNCNIDASVCWRCILKYAYFADCIPKNDRKKAIKDITKYILSYNKCKDIMGKTIQKYEEEE